MERFNNFAVQENFEKFQNKKNQQKQYQYVLIPIKDRSFGRYIEEFGCH